MAARTPQRPSRQSIYFIIIFNSASRWSLFIPEKQSLKELIFFYYSYCGKRSLQFPYPQSPIPFLYSGLCLFLIIVTLGASVFIWPPRGDSAHLLLFNRVRHVGSKHKRTRKLTITIFSNNKQDYNKNYYWLDDVLLFDKKQSSANNNITVFSINRYRQFARRSSIKKKKNIIYR